MSGKNWRVSTDEGPVTAREVVVALKAEVADDRGANFG